MGAVLDPSDATVSGATVRLVNKKTSEEQSTTSDGQERFEFQFLSSGRYEFRADKASFEPLRPKVINITVTETLRIELHLRLPAMSQSTPGWGVGFYIEKFEVVGVASRHS